MSTQRIEYDDKTVRYFLWASVAFGIIGMLVGAIVALQLAWWPANVAPWLSFGRLRPLHTNAVIFAFVGNMAFAGIYYSTQRLTKARTHDTLSKIHFWGWQLIILAAVVTLPLGYTQSKEYAELEWPIDIAITVVWLVFAANFFYCLKRRQEKHLYVALWFYIATIITVALLHVVNSLAIPVGGLKSYSAFAGVQDALVQWWYGHNAVAFFLTTPILGIMYYFLPKAADRPVYSYRLSIIHFWGLVFIYIWAGPHHLLYTALPDWAQSLGMVFSLMLWAPSWGGMLNGLLTLRGAWDKLRRDPVLKFFAAGVTFYGMATLEGPLLSIKSVSGLAHYTDWIIAHVHGGALGWNGFMAAGMFYWLVPRLYKTKLRSVAAANLHFTIGTFGILLYVGSMWIAGIEQGLMWREMTDGGGLAHPNFVDTLLAIRSLYWMRLIGGLLYLAGFIVMAWNLIATARQGEAVNGAVEVQIPEAEASYGQDAEDGSKTSAEPSGKKLVFGTPVLVSGVVLGLVILAGFVDVIPAVVLVVLASAVAAFALVLSSAGKKSGESWHSRLEGRSAPFTVLVLVAVLIGGVAEIVPSVVTVPEQIASTGNVPYSALEVEGRDVYVREGCYTCHSQMIRPFVWETARYGPVSEPDDSIFDHPFQWGSRRIGPDLARIGGRYTDTWHYRHMRDPREISAGSNMPPFDHLSFEELDFAETAPKMRALRTVGVPYTPEQIQRAEASANAQAREITEFLASDGGVRVCADSSESDCDLYANSRLVALIAYLQRIGKVPENGMFDVDANGVALGGATSNASDAPEDEEADAEAETGSEVDAANEATEADESGAANEATEAPNTSDNDNTAAQPNGAANEEETP